MKHLDNQKLRNAIFKMALNIDVCRVLSYTLFILPIYQVF